MESMASFTSGAIFSRIGQARGSSTRARVSNTVLGARTR